MNNASRMGSTHELPVGNASSCNTMVRWTRREEGRYLHRLQKRLFSLLLLSPWKKGPFGLKKGKMQGAVAKR